MKNLITGSLFMLFLLVACSHSKHEIRATNNLLIDEARVLYAIADKPWPAEYLGDKSISILNYIPHLLYKSKIDYPVFIKKYIKKALELNVSMYEPLGVSGNPYLHKSDYVLFNNQEKWSSFIRNKEDFDTVNLTNNIEKIKFDNYTSLYFLESWYFNLKNLEFRKDIKFVSPIERYFRDDRYVRSLSGLIVPNKVSTRKELNESNKRMEFVGTLVYEYFFNPRWDIACHNDPNSDEIVNRDAPGLGSFIYKRIFDNLIHRAMNGEISVYNYGDNSKKLSSQKVKENCGFIPRTIGILDEFGNVSNKKIDAYLDLSEFASIIFEEELYVDWETLRISKKVKSISPVRYYEDDNSPIEKRIVAFTLKL